MVQDLNQNILLHQDLGLGPKYINYERRITYSTAAKEAMKIVLKEEIIAENNYQLGIKKFSEATQQRWKNYWWDCLVTIYKNCKDFAKKYNLDLSKLEGKVLVGNLSRLDAVKAVDVFGFESAVTKKL